MFRKTLTACLFSAVALCLSLGVNAPQAADVLKTHQPQSLDGLWSGAWGGGVRGDGVVMQPVIAELLVDGDEIELRGFHNATSLAGKVRVDALAQRIYVTAENAKADAAGKKPEVAFDYRLKGDQLLLTDGDKFEITLSKKAAKNAAANAHVDLVESSGINDTGDLLITEYTALRAGRAGKEYRLANSRTLKTKDARVALVQQDGYKLIGIQEARKLLGKGAAVAIAYRDEKPAPDGVNNLSTELGSSAADSDAALTTAAKGLRPGILLFVLAAKENVVLP